MRSGTYESSEGNNVGTAVTFLLIGIVLAPQPLSCSLLRPENNSAKT